MVCLLPVAPPGNSMLPMNKLRVGAQHSTAQHMMAEVSTAQDTRSGCVSCDQEGCGVLQTAAHEATDACAWLCKPIKRLAHALNCRQTRTHNGVNEPVSEEEVLVERPRQLKPQALKHIRLQCHCKQAVGNPAAAAAQRHSTLCSTTAAAGV